MLAHLAALMLASAAADTSAVQCGIHNLDACQNTNQLVWDDNFDDALRKFVGNQSANWLYEDGTEIGQVIDVLGGPPDDKVELPSGLLRFSACRPHSCDEKGAVFLTPDGTIEVIAILHFNCGNGCSDAYTLTILVHKEDEHFVKHAETWAADVLNEHDREFPRYPLPRWDKVEVLMRP